MGEIIAWGLFGVAALVFMGWVYGLGTVLAEALKKGASDDCK